MKKGIQEAERKSLCDYFVQLKDPRSDRNKKHKLLDIITIAICAVIANADDWNEIELWGRCKEDWLKTFLELPHGIPSHDTFNRVFSALDPHMFFHCFVSWIYSINEALEGTVLSIDGKSLRRSYDTEKSPLHMVNVWASDLNISLGQIKTDTNSNEITAIPDLLNRLVVKGCIITIDAMGCQKAIASLIKEKKGDYVLALKGNQSSLYEDVKLYFEDHEKSGFKEGRFTTTQTLEKDHGRIEKRFCVATNDIKWLTQKNDWKGLTSICMIISEREVKGQKTIQRRYYITSLAPEAEKLCQLIRSHWSIENKLHWQLDVTFKEDQSRLREKTSAENFAALRRMALTLLKQETSEKVSLKCKRLAASLSDKYLLKVLAVKK